MEPAGPQIIFNDRALRNPRTGVGHYITELLGALPGVAPDIRVLPFYEKILRRAGRTDRGTRPADAPARRPAAWTRRLAQELYAAAFEGAGTLGGYQLYHEPNHIPMPWHGPIVTTVHDLSVLRHPEWHPADRVDWYGRDFEIGVARTTHFLSVSEFTRQEMVDLLDLDPDRITVIPNGVRPIFHPRPVQQARRWLGTAGLPEGFILFVGTIEPRKNLETLLAAFAGLPPGLRSRLTLVVAGMTGWAREGLHAMAQRHGVADRVRGLGYVGDEDLAWLYCGARLLAWPSLYEGFGLPPLEAMACGTPVITSNCSAMPEVVGDAGLLVDPRNPRGLRDAMAAVLEQPDFAQTLAHAGLERSRQFTWQQSAAAHAQIYRRFATA